MRESMGKYRGKRIDNGEWVYGSLWINATIKERLCCVITEWTMEDGLNVAMEWSVSASTVGQFTGMKDKNGADIYEGDLINDGEYTDKIIWKDSMWWVEGADDVAHTYNIDSVIIGNIHEGEWCATDTGFIRIDNLEENECDCGDCGACRDRQRELAGENAMECERNGD